MWTLLLGIEVHAVRLDGGVITGGEGWPYADGNEWWGMTYIPFLDMTSYSYTVVNGTEIMPAPLHG